MRKFNVLIVDDSLITIRRITEMLMKAGHIVVGTARSGRAALNEYERTKPDIVTMDITMPDMDGIEATKKLLQQDPDAIIVMITSHGQEIMVLDAINAGAKGYLLKPINLERLVETLNDIYEKFGDKNGRGQSI